MLNWLDDSPAVLKYASEEIKIPYWNPIKKRWANYFPDFLVIVKTANGIERLIVEVKPAKESKIPRKDKRKKPQAALYEQATYLVNSCKWEAAIQFCKQRGLKFKVVTEKDIF